MRINLFSGIQARFVTVVVGILVLLTLTVTWAVVRAIQKNIYHTADKDIARDARTLKKLHEQRTAELFTRAKLLAAEPRVIAALGTPDIDRPTVQFLAEEIRADGDLDLLMVWGMGDWGSVLSMRGGAAGDSAWMGFTPPGSQGSFMAFSGRDVHGVSVEVEIQGTPHGHLMIGDLVRETHFRAIESLIGSELILSASTDSGPARILASSLVQASRLNPASVSAWTSYPRDSPFEIDIPFTGERFLARTMDLDRGITGILLKSTEPARQAATSTAGLAAAIAIGFLAVSSLIIVLMTQSITRPIRKLLDGTEAISAGNFGTRTDILNPDELRRLSQSFNGMAERIEKLLDSEKQAKADLEKRVEERTKELSEVNRLLVNAHQQLKNQMAQIVRFEKLASIGTMAAGIAHEINNPLMGVMGFAQLMSESLADPDARRDAQKIYVEAERCSDIIRKLLRFSRQEGPTALREDIHPILDRALDIARMGRGFMEVDVIKIYDPQVPAVMVDVIQIEQVFVNLAVNAFQAMREKAGRQELTVKTESADGSVRIKFSDTGAGIPASVIDKIFDPFFTTKAVGQGTGLGLSVSLGIVEQHGGRLFVETTGATGTTMTVELHQT